MQDIRISALRGPDRSWAAQFYGENCASEHSLHGRRPGSSTRASTANSTARPQGAFRRNRLHEPPNASTRGSPRPPEGASHPTLPPAVCRYVIVETSSASMACSAASMIAAGRLAPQSRCAPRAAGSAVASTRAPAALDAFAHPLARGVRSRGVRRPRLAPAASHRALQHGLRRGRAPVRQEARGDGEDHQVLGRGHRERRRARRDGRSHGCGGVDPPGFDDEDRSGRRT